MPSPAVRRSAPFHDLHSAPPRARMARRPHLIKALPKAVFVQPGAGPAVAGPAVVSPTAWPPQRFRRLARRPHVAGGAGSASRLRADG
jgi:hypothetical protein